ncbi:MAG: Hsp70 family protein [Myxococcales bacterium]|nr:Hsp70 family protein [Myxococcales bacterium]
MKNAGPTLGIDFGTSYSSAAVVIDGSVELVIDGGDRSIPSVVYFPERGAPQVGRAALSRLPAEPHQTVSSIKRVLGRRYDDTAVRRLDVGVGYKLARGPGGSVVLDLPSGRVAPAQVVGLILDRLRGLAERRFGGPITRAVLSVPATADAGYRAALSKAAQLARLEVVRMVAEPVVGALAVGKNMTPATRNIAVCDFGGGTFDLTLAQQRGHDFTCPLVAGDGMLGGDDFDEAIANMVADAVATGASYDMRHSVVRWRGLVLRAEQVKRVLSRTDVARLRMKDAYTAFGRQRDLDIEIGRGRAERRFQPLLDRAVMAVDDLRARAEARGCDVDEVLLIGGTSLIPSVQAHLADAFHRPVELTAEADVVVAIGAALLADALTSTSVDKDPYREAASALL